VCVGQTLTGTGERATFEVSVVGSGGALVECPALTGGAGGTGRPCWYGFVRAFGLRDVTCAGERFADVEREGRANA